MIPCKECLKLALCISKKVISCEDLYLRFHEIADETIKSPWTIVEETLPNLQHISRERDCQ